MRRRMVITVVNTGNEEIWLLDKEHLAHGKWMDGSPPPYIKTNSTEKVESEKQTGAAYGTTGSITFVSGIRAGSTLKIDWNKPYGTDATTCAAAMTGDQYSAIITSKDFQHSEAFCDVVISVKAKP